MRTSSQLLALAFSLLIFGCDVMGEFPQDQKLEGPFSISQQWLHVTLEEPFEINREGLQRLHLVVDPGQYQPNSDLADELSDNPDHLFDLRSRDNELVVPEVVLIAQDGSEVALTSTANMFPFEGGLTIGMGLFDNMYAPPPPFPEHVDRFVSFRVRSNEPFEVEYFWWSVDRHPDMFQ